MPENNKLHTHPKIRATGKLVAPVYLAHPTTNELHNSVVCERSSDISLREKRLLGMQRSLFHKEMYHKSHQTVKQHTSEVPSYTHKHRCLVWIVGEKT